MNKECRDRAILLRTYDLSETSLIVHWFGQHYGLCKTVVKGGKSKNSKYLGKLELFSFQEIHFYWSHTGSDLHSLIGCDLERNISALRGSYPKLLVASYFSSLLEHWLITEQEAGDLFSLTERALNYLDEKELEWRAVTYYEKELSRLLGYSAEPAEVRKIYQASAKLMTLREKIQSSLTPSS